MTVIQAAVDVAGQGALALKNFNNLVYRNINMQYLDSYAVQDMRIAYVQAKLDAVQGLRGTDVQAKFD